MKIQYCSDLHLEFKENSEFLNANPIKPVGEILILAGDIFPLKHIEDIKGFINYVSDNFKEVYMIPGNHEWYRYNIPKEGDSLDTDLRDNVHLINNKEVKIGDTNFIFSTMWSHVKRHNAHEVAKTVNDFRLIGKEGRTLTVPQFNKFHENALEFLKDAVKKSVGQKTVVITHHVPTIMNYPPEYINSPINGAFAVELHDFILDSGVDYWIYGHHHRNIPEFNIGKTKMLTNQLGYVYYMEHKGFKLDALIEI